MNDKYLLGIVFCIFLVMFISERKYHLKKQRGGEVSGVVVLGGILFVVAIIGGAVWYFTRDGSSPTPSPTPTPTTTIQTSQSNTCTCENGVGATGFACPSDGAPRCASCNEGYHLNGGNCTYIPLDECLTQDIMSTSECDGLQYDDNNRFLNNQQECPQQCLDKLNQMSAIVMDPSNTCYQSLLSQVGGDASIITDNRNTCQSLIDQQNTCTCENGAPATGSDCTSEGASICATCNGGYTLDDDDNCIMGEPIDCYAMTIANHTNCSDLQYDDNIRILNNQQVCSQDCLDSINDLSDTVGNPDDTCHQIIVGALGGDVSTASSLINDNKQICQNLPRS
jgi:hypothetical protein